jgi:protein-S-isoprenylcysteine O-methyltransferase
MELNRLHHYNRIVTYIDYIALCWAAFLVYWGASATHVKKDVRRLGSPWISLVWRVVFALAVIYAVRVPSVRDVVVRVHSYTAPLSGMGLIGVMLCASGIAFAIWARKTLGENWSSRPSVKAGHELVTSGPYRYVRHPIYSGMLLGLLGTAAAIGLPGLVMFLVVCGVFANRVRAEDQLMTEQFPDWYPEYRRQTKAIVPYVL